ncbi:MAG: chromosomal replication initiator DnaA [Planktomarina sp.]
MAEQLTFDLPMRTARGRDAFFVSHPNALALAMLDNTQNWPQGKLLILGPKGSGKTHLLDIWIGDNNGLLWSPEWDHLPDESAAVAVDNVDWFARDPDAQTKLFHLHNYLAATGGRLLLTSTIPIIQAGFTLPDLTSRLTATTATRIDAPDEALIEAVILKHFMDRQIAPSPTVQRYIAQNVDRSFDAVATVITELDARSMAGGGKITRALAAQVIADHAD